MKYIISNKQRTTLGILTAISLSIWFLGPLIVVSNRYPLAQAEERFYIIVVLFLAWALKIIFLDIPTPNRTITSSQEHPEIVKKINALNNRFQGALEFLKKTFISKHGTNISLATLPWYLLIGPAGSGKTTLLANSSINFILAKQFKTENLKVIPPSDGCDWWVTRDAVLIDIPGGYLGTKGKFKPSQATTFNTTTPLKNTPVGLKLWNNLIQLIKKYRNKQTISGVVFTLNLPELINSQHNQQQEQHICDLKHRITEIKAEFGEHIPFHLVITKCDLLPGFLEFFSDSSSDELAQAWGITLPVLKENEKLLDVFSNHFNALIKRINKQLIWRMHQERNPFSRPAIKDFPLQIERLKDAVASILKELAPTTAPLHLCSVYLTSGIQNLPENHQTTPLNIISNSSQQSLQIMRNPTMPVRAYFVRQLILQGLLHATPHANLTNITYGLGQKQKIAYALAIGAVMISSLWIGNNFRQSIKQIYATKNALTQYQTAARQAGPEESILTKALPLLALLQQTANSETQRSSLYTSKEQQLSVTVYKQAVQSILLPEIKNLLQKYLVPDNNQTPISYYAALKTYLMLGNLEHLQSHVIANTIKQLQPNTFSPEELNMLANHIDILTANERQPLQLDDELISQARKRLASLNHLDLSYVILQDLVNNNNPEQSLNLNTSVISSVFISQSIPTSIPYLFTAAAFEPVVSKDISMATIEALRGNWVIGNLTANPATSTTSLAEQLQYLYINHYANFWENTIEKLQLIHPKDLTELEILLTNLTTTNSPLSSLLQTVQQNIAPLPILDASAKLRSLSTFLTTSSDISNSELAKVLGTLRSLNTDLKHCKSDGKAAFQIAAARMQNSTDDSLSQLNTLALQSPEPIKDWLSLILAQSWNYILQNTSRYIEHAWQKNVMSIYRSDIANRYPFVETSQEVDLRSLTAFLGKQGEFYQFYQQFLKPFVNESDKKWQWQFIDNQKIPFSQVALDQLQQANRIQQLFFSTLDNRPSISFTLQPLSLTKNLKSFHLNINGQVIDHEAQAAPVPLSATWPGTDNIHITTVSFTSLDNKTISNSISGDWAWFRLVDKATQTISDNKKQIILSFDKDSYSAKYMLFTRGNVNPFLPQNLQHFHLPEQLHE